MSVVVVIVSVPIAGVAIIIRPIVEIIGTKAEKVMRRVGVRLHASRGLDDSALLAVGYAVGRYRHAHSQQWHYNSSVCRPAVRFHVRCAFHSLPQHWQRPLYFSARETKPA